MFIVIKANNTRRRKRIFSVRLELTALAEELVIYEGYTTHFGWPRMF